MLTAVDAPDAKLRKMLLAMREHIAAGSAVHETLAKFPRFFPRYYTDLVKSGEKAGNLAESLEELEDALVRTSAFRAELRTVLAYVGGILFLELVTVTGVCLWIIPQFAKIFTSIGAVPTTKLRFLAGASGFLRSIPAAILLLAMLGVAAFLLRRGPRAFMERFRKGALVLRIPVLRTVHQKKDLAHAASVLETLLDAGVPLAEALHDAACLDINPVFAMSFRRIAGRVEQGESLKTAIDAEARVLPPSYRGLVSLGERSALLPEAFGRLAGAYRREALNAARLLLSIVPPIVLCWIGLLVYVVYSGIFEAILHLPGIVGG